MKSFLDFVALHFVVANHKASSACVLGICAVKNKQIIERKEWVFKSNPDFIKPPKWQKSEIIIEDMKNAPEFLEVWDEIFDWLDNQTVLVHNKSYEIRTLRALLDANNLQSPNFEMFCVMRWGRGIWNDLENYQKRTLAKHIGWDKEVIKAIDSAELVVELTHVMQNELQLIDPKAIEAKIAPKLKASQGYTSRAPRKKVDFKALRENTTLAENVDENHILNGKLVVFTGSGEMDREEAMEEVLRLGGDVKDSLTKDVNILVIGGRAWKAYEEKGKKSNKIKKAESYNEKYDSGILIISERDFMINYLENLIILDDEDDE